MTVDNSGVGDLTKRLDTLFQDFSGGLNIMGNNNIVQQGLTNTVISGNDTDPLKIDDGDTEAGDNPASDPEGKDKKKKGKKKPHITVPQDYSRVDGIE